MENFERLKSYFLNKFKIKMIFFLGTKTGFILDIENTITLKIIR